jgi:predicted phage terminase large subunit-like protein
VGLSSYAADLANTLSRNARDNYRLAGNAVKSDAAGVQHWETGHGGGLWATGAGGPATGKGAHLLVVDDPVKNAEEAASEVIRAKIQDWWNSTWYTREEPWSETDPSGAMIVVQTRWHEDDLSGWLLDQERQSEEEEDRERWHIVNLPAIAEDPHPFPSTCTIEPDWRQNGEALCPERRPLEKLEKIRARISGYYFDALFQQRPTAKEGEFFKMGKLEIVPVAPAGLRLCRGWDLGATKNDGSYTVGTLVGVDSAGVWYVLDVVRGQWSSDETRLHIRNTAITDGAGVKIHLPQDPGQAGKDQGMQYVRFLAGFNVKVEPVTGAKETRADQFAAQWNAGNVKIVESPWRKAFIEEYRQFPRGKFSDQVDSGSDAFTELALGGEYRQWEFVR